MPGRRGNYTEDYSAKNPRFQEIAVKIVKI